MKMKFFYPLVIAFLVIFNSCDIGKEVIPDPDDIEEEDPFVDDAYYEDGDGNLDEDDEDEDPQSTEGEIYFRWTQDLTYPDCGGCGGNCEIISGNFKDNNDAVPDFALENEFYGPCDPGSYNAQYNFDRNKTTSPSTFSYTLERPAKGYIRYYTKLLRDYNAPLNRCVAMDKEPASLSYVDVPADGSAGEPGSGNDPEPEPEEKTVQFYVNPEKFSRATGLEITSIIINSSSTYYPKAYIDNCPEGYTMEGYGSESYFRYKIHLKNYNSLDAMMNGLEYASETSEGIVYLSDLKAGCNTLEFDYAGGAQLYGLSVKE